MRPCDSAIKDSSMFTYRVSIQGAFHSVIQIDTSILSLLFIRISRKIYRTMFLCYQMESIHNKRTTWQCQEAVYYKKTIVIFTIDTLLFTKEALLTATPRIQKTLDYLLLLNCADERQFENFCKFSPPTMLDFKGTIDSLIVKCRR